MTARWRAAAAAAIVAAIAIGASGMTAVGGGVSIATAATKHRGLLVSHCEFSHRASDDPIVHVGMPGMSHSHDFFGNVSTGADSTTTSLQHGATTCHIAGDRAAYWAPTLYANGVAVRPTGMLAYYIAATNAAPKPLPVGLKIVAGGRDVVRYACMAHGMPRAQHMRPTTCHSGEQLSLAVRFPECWDGTDLDSMDHRSHMAYATKGACPRSHPVAVPRVVLWVLYPRQANVATLTLASGGLDTAHADLFNAWVTHDYNALHSYCLTASATRRSRASCRSSTSRVRSLAR